MSEVPERWRYFGLTPAHYRREKSEAERRAFEQKQADLDARDEFVRKVAREVVAQRDAEFVALVRALAQQHGVAAVRALCERMNVAPPRDLAGDDDAAEST